MAKNLKKYWLVILILVLASFFRFYRLSDYMEFLGDQGRDLLIIRNFLKNGDLFFIGPQTSIGNMYLGPYYYYLIAPSLLIARFSPTGPAVFIALLGVLTVFLVYYFCRHWFDHSTALIASFLYAISPVVIKYSTFSWNPNVLPLFALLFIYFVDQRRYLPAVLSFIMAINSHYLALILLPLALIFWIRNRDYRLRLTPSLLAVLIFFLSLLPQVLFDFRHHGQNLTALISFFSQRQSTVNFKVYKSLPHLWPLHQQLVTRLLAGKNVSLGIIVAALFIIGLIYLCKLRLKHLGIIIVWYFIGLFCLGLYKQHIYDHYFGFLFPAPFILIALMIRYWRYFGYLILCLLIYLSLKENPFWYSPPQQLATVQKIVAFIDKQSGNLPFNFALLAKQDYDPPYLYYFYQRHLSYYPIKNHLADQLFVLCEPFQIDCQPINHPFWDIAAFGWAKVERQWQINGLRLFLLVHNPRGLP